MSLLVTMPVSTVDVRLAMELLDWIERLGRCPENPGLLVLDCKLSKEQFKGVADKAASIFKSLEVTTTAFALPSEKWPIGPNWMFETALRYLESTHSTRPFLWLEPDCVPMREGWLKDLDDAYKSTRKPFMGQLVLPGLPGLPKEMLSGVAIYPGDAPKRLLKAVVQTKTKGAFDVTTAPLVVPNAQHTRLIWNFYGEKDLPPTFVKLIEPGHPKNALPLSAIPPMTVLFHRSKDGSLINLLRGDSDATIPQILMAWKMSREIVTKPVVRQVTKLPTFYHVVERHAQRTADDERRVLTAVNSWLALYKTGRVVPCHLWENDYPRTALTIGDKRNLPYFKDVIAEGMTRCKNPNDFVLWTNDDTVLHPGVVDEMMAKLKSVPCVGSFRVNFDKVDLDDIAANPDTLRLRGEKDSNGTLRTDLGRDLFAWRKSWLTEHWHEIPDFLLGELEFDVVMAVMVRREAGIFTDKRNVLTIQPSCELEKGFVLHQKHERQWTSAAAKDSPAKLHNKKLAICWYAEQGFPSLISNF